MQKKQLAVVMMAALSAVSYAQTDSLAELDTVMVESVYAVPVDRDNIGSSVTVLTEKDFQNRQATYVIDALRTVPGIAVGATGGRGAQSSVFLRGAESDHVLVVIDGVKVNPASGNAFDFGTLPLSHIARIEVLRGEQSALWGSPAVGGVINIITKSGKHADKPFNATVHLGGGSNKTADLSATLSGRQDSFYYAVHANHSQTDGISAKSRGVFSYQTTNGQPLQTGGWKEDDAFEQTGLSLRLGYDFIGAGIEALYQYTENTVHFDPSSKAQEMTADDQTENQQALVKLSGYLGSEEDVYKQSAYFSLTDLDSRTQSQYPDKSAGKTVNAGYQLDYHFDRDGQTTQAVSLLLEHKKDSFNSNNYPNEKSLKENSVALEYRLFDEADHALSLGLRHDNHSKAQDSTTYKLAGGYRFNDVARIHASIGTGVKTPTVFDYYGWNGQYLGNPELKAEQSRGGEIGVSLNSVDESHVLDMTYFNRRVDNFIDTQYSADYTTAQSINLAGTTKVSGWELTYQGQVTAQLTAYANYTYTEAENAKGERLQRRPKHQANLGVDYRLNDQLSTYASANFVGKRLNKYFDSVTYQSSDVNMPSYEVFNVGANYQLSKQLSGYLNINNVFDKKYENVIGYGQPERTFYLGIKGQW